MYTCEIRERIVTDYCPVESATLCQTWNECAKWFYEHGVNILDTTMTQYDNGNIIAKYVYIKE